MSKRRRLGFLDDQPTDDAFSALFEELRRDRPIASERRRADHKSFVPTGIARKGCAWTVPRDRYTFDGMAAPSSGAWLT